MTDTLISDTEEFIEIQEPYGNILIVHPDSAETVSAGGIYIPDKAQEKPHTATVITVGPGLKTGPDGETTPCMSKPGDRITYLRAGVIRVTSGGIEFHVISESDVLFRTLKIKKSAVS